MKDNVQILRESVDKIRSHIAKTVMPRLAQRANEVCQEAQRQRQWLGFTGQSLAGYGYSSMDINRDSYYGYSGITPVADKVPQGERVYLEHPIEGVARSVKGYFDIEFSDVKEAFDELFPPPIVTNQLIGVMRFAYPIEYAKWLVAAGEKTPLELMNALAQVAFKDI